MTTRLFTRLKTPWTAAVALLMAVVASLGLIRWPLGDEIVAPRLQQALGAYTGYTVESLGEVSFSALPWPSIQITDLKLRKPAPSQERVEATVLKARINLASWLLGRPRIVALTLFDPVLSLASSENIQDTEALSTTMLNFLSQDRRIDLKGLRVERGTIRLDGAPWMMDLKLAVSNVAGSDVSLRAEGTYRGQPVSIMIDVAQGGSQLLRPVSWRAATPAMTATFSGQLFGPRTLDAEGEFQLAIANGADIARRYNLDPVHAGLLNGLKLQGQTRVTWPFIQIRQAMIERGDERLQGFAELSVDARKPTLSATLDTAKFDATALLAPLVARLTDRAGQWSRETISSRWLNAAAIDVRLSAAKLVVGQTTIEQAAASGQIGAGRIELMLNDGRLRGGSLKGRGALVAESGGRIDFRGQASTERMEAQTLLEAFGLARIKGTASGQIAIEGSGGSVDQIISSLEGRAVLSVRDGEINGVDIDRLAQRIERSAVGTIPMDGRTRFQTITLPMRVMNGAGHVTDGLLATPASRLPLEGAIDLHKRTLDLNGRLLPGGATPRTGEIKLRLEGPWANPAVSTDLGGRQGRS
jgi:AsmA protein